MSNTMQAVMLNDYSGGAGIRYGEVAIPVIQKDEVLIKVHAASINPADLLFMNGTYGIKRELPCVGGMEGCGTVVATGSSVIARMLKGKRVAFVSEGYGSWAEYTKASAMTCMVLPDHVSDEQGAVFFVNPASALAMIRIAKKQKSKAIVQTAGASALGKVLVKLGEAHDIPIISIVRKEEHVELLRSIGGIHIVNSQSDGFEDALEQLCSQLGATVCFDAVGGALTGTVLSAMPDGSTLYQYGLLSGGATTVQADDLVFRRKQIVGFWASDWVKTQSIFELLSLQSEMKKWIGSRIQTEISQTFPLQQAAEALDQYQRQMTAGKVLLLP
ncbi:zinc-binding dehydrogenase [Paenibacillus aestuarii]|uniref:Zinc-binding dehydrogenase n=1 Tax=Paenibacillus aestuarii TaxID=516965 RepID=A0ABW0K7G9_9BACL|nr:zinc-binding dehydrogenase [Paenibacillus aestuarii]